MSLYLIFSLDSLHSSNVYRRESDRRGTLPFFLSFHLSRFSFYINLIFLENVSLFISEIYALLLLFSNFKVSALYTRLISFINSFFKKIKTASPCNRIGNEMKFANYKCMFGMGKVISYL